MDTVVLVLFPNRFATPDAGVTDVNRAFVYPYEEFDAGSMRIGEIRVDGVAVAATPMSQPGVPDGCLLRVALPRPLPPGATVALRAGFETVVPTRFGSFGEFEGMLTAVGGWYPYLPALRADGTWAVDALPALADFEVDLVVDPSLEIVLNGRHVAHPAAAVHVEVSGTHYLSLVAAPALLRAEVDAGATHVVLLRRPALGPPCAGAESGRDYT